MSNEPFNGLTMPVFTAFSWAGQEQAIQYALGQLDEFIKLMHLRLSRETQTIFPQRGLDKTSQGVFLARDLETQRDLYMTFHASARSFRYAVSLFDRNALNRAFKAIQNDQSGFYDALSALEGWELRIQQMEYNPETEEATNYRDLYKGAANALTPSESAEIIERAVYLNGEEKWLATVQLSKRSPAEFIAAMGTAVTSEVAKEVDNLLPVLRFLVGGVKKRPAASRKKTPKKKSTAKRKKATAASVIAEEEVQTFTYIAKLKPMHINRGFVNMTEAHWPFFSINSRTVTRDIILKYEETIDRESAVWRMVPSDKARLVLSDPARDWLDDNFSPNDEIQITAKKLGLDKNDKIEIEIEMVS